LKNFTASDLRNRELAYNSLVANLRYIEAFEVAARSGALLLDETSKYWWMMADSQTGDNAHLIQLTQMLDGGEAWVSEDLKYSLVKVLRSGWTLGCELAHLTIVEPSMQAIAEILGASDPGRRNFWTAMASDEESHRLLANLMGEHFQELDDRFSQFIEEHALLLYTTVLPSDEGKMMLQTVTGEGREGLEGLYRMTDELRAKTVEMLFSSNSRTLKTIKGYGLARTGLC
jgi:hypothetical protein